MISQHLFTVGGAHANRERERKKVCIIHSGREKKENRTTSMVGSGQKKKKKKLGKKKPTTPAVPRRSPIQVLSGPDTA